MSSIKKIVITGPESSGKTTLAQQLAVHFKTQWVPEFARSYLQRIDRPYVREDLLKIAYGQTAMEDRKKLEATQYLFCDTGLEVIKIWSLVKYREVHPQLLDLLAKRSYGGYLLCRPDLEWESDPLRETPDPEDRWRLFELYRKELQQLDLPWVEISGRGQHRLQLAIQAVQKLYE